MATQAILSTAANVLQLSSSLITQLSPILIKLLLLYSYGAITAAWSVLAVRRLPPGKQRLAAVLPVVVGNLLIPLVLDPHTEALFITPIAGIFSLAAFKLLAYAIGRGPLVPHWLSPLQFCGVFLLPIVPIQVFTVGPQDSAQRHVVKQGRQMLLDSWANAGVAMLVSWVLAVPGLPVMVRHWLYTLASATFLTAVFNVLAAAAYMMLGITSAPTFDKPWLSSSFQDFWARRWNLTTTYMMRVLVYEPVIEGRLLPKSDNEALTAMKALAPAGESTPTTTPEERQSEGSVVGAAAATATAKETHYSVNSDANDSGLRRRFADRDDAVVHSEDGLAVGPDDKQKAATHAETRQEQGTDARVDRTGVPARERRRVSKLRTFLGLQAVFLVSGLWHILIFWYNTHVFSWRWCAFFAIQASILMVERALRNFGRAAGVRVPHALKVVTANFLLIVVAKPLFFGPADTTGFAARNLAVGQAPLWVLLDVLRRCAAK